MDFKNDIKTTTANSRFAKAGVSCFYDIEVLNSRFVHLIKFSAKNPHLRVAANRCMRLGPSAKLDTKYKPTYMKAIRFSSIKVNIL
jgi:hypothetical protein